METKVKTVGKSAHFDRTPAKEGADLLVNNKELRELFEGKTLWDMGNHFAWGSENVKWTKPVVVRGNTIQQLAVIVGDSTYLVPVARGYDIEKAKANVDYFLASKFYATFKAKKEADGTPMMDDKGVAILDEMAPYISFGKPSGIVVEGFEDALPAEKEEAEYEKRNG